MLARAVKANPRIPQIKTEWAVVLAQLHRYSDAQRALIGVSLPEDRQERITFYRLKGSIALGLGNPSDAASAMEKALALSPNDEGLALAAATAQLQSKDWERAAALAQPVFSGSHNPTAGLILLEAEIALKHNFRRTLDELRSTNLTSTDELVFRQRIAQVLIAYGQIGDAVEDLKVVTEMAPTRGDLFFNLALAQFRAGRVDDALASAQKSKELSDTADLEDLLGDIEEARGDNLSAVRNYQSAVALAPNEEKYRLSLAVELIRHKNFDAAKAVLQQSANLWPKSWRVQLALGMVEYFSGTDQEASRILMHAADLAPRPHIALKYLADIQKDQSSPPDTEALSRVCKYSNLHPRDGYFELSCGTILFRRDYASGNKAGAAEILHRLRAASTLLPNDAAPHCELGRALRWIEDWQGALAELETCVRLDPDSAEAHYRLAQLYQHFNRGEDSQREMQLYEVASKHVADENARREQALKTFLLTIQKETPDQN
jgi:tetratricopeptide (TPR) repeat protein